MDSASRRLQVTMRHIMPDDAAELPQLAAAACAAEATSAKPDRKDVLKWNGWGYNDTVFKLNKDGVVELTGKRYLFSGRKMPYLRPFMESVVGIDMAKSTPSREFPAITAPRVNDAFMADIKSVVDRISLDDRDRMFHAHGHTLQELYHLRNHGPMRVPDVVVYPGCHAHCEALVRAATQHDVCLIPFGGGTSVTWALLVPENEHRMVVSVDMTHMSKVLWVDKTSMTARIEAGIVGVDLQRELEKQGVTIGHEPDSVEFSTLGGWISTRASGMKKNIYGNIEDILVSVRLVTPSGTFEKGCTVPRMSSGPDLHHVVLGSEGTMGIITEATLKIRMLPPVRVYGSLVFPDLESGVAALSEVSRRRVAPASIRLVDNEQFKFGQALKEEVVGTVAHMSERFKKFYITQYLGFDPHKMTVVTLLFEGTQEEVDRQQKEVYSIASKYRGISGGEENGMRGYMLTFMIAYLRDIGLDYDLISESFETSVPWNNVLPLCNGVKACVKAAAAKYGIKREPFVSCRVTQLYDTGVCVYFYFAFLAEGLQDPVDVFNKVEHEAREEILKHGGSVSHHHGIGKLRKEFMSATVGQTGLTVLRGLKHSVDPRNVFGSNNIIDP